MRAVDVIRRKRDGHALEPAEIDAFVQGVTARTWPDYQAASMLMAIFQRGMSPSETANLTRAMVQSGDKLDWSDLPDPKVDKHSTGGVGDKTSLILAPLAAACGVVVPMMSGRGLGHTGGTLDKLEAIPGFRVGLSLAEFRDALKNVGCAMIGQTREIAPADKLLYALRDVTATVESIPLITASIMSKKIAEGIDALVLDVKCGQGAFMKTREDARVLAQSLVATGRNNGVRTEAVLTAMDAPLGRVVGNALEVRECLAVLRGAGPKSLEDLSVELAARMVLLGGLAASLAEATSKVRQALSSGAGLQKFREIVVQQGGDPRVVDEPDLLMVAPQRIILRAERGGHVGSIHAERVGRAAMALGAGRDRVEDAVDPSVGVIVLAHVGEAVKFGDGLAEIHCRNDARLPACLQLLREAWSISDSPPEATQLILETIDA